ncbi:MAG: hypothetical protein EZS28_052019, partial [Streblomastix strix]
WEALSKLIKTCPNFRDELVRYGFIETVRYSLLDDDTPIHVQSNIIDIVTQLLLNQTDPQSMSELIGVLQRKVDLNDNDNELQIGRKSKYIMTLLSSYGVTGGQSVKEMSRLSKMNEEYKREIILLRSEFEERLRQLDEYKHGERNTPYLELMVSISFSLKTISSTHYLDRSYYCTVIAQGNQVCAKTNAGGSWQG